MIFDPIVVHAKLNIPTLIHACNMLIIPMPASDCWWRWYCYV